MKILNLAITLISLFIYSSCNVAMLVGAETELDPDIFNTGKKYFKVAASCKGGGSGSQMCIYDSKGAFIGKSDIGGSTAYNANIANVYGFSNHVYFSADNGSIGSELYRMSFENGGYELVADLDTGAGSGLPDHFADDGTNLYFIASDGSANAQICTYTGSGTPSCVGISSGGGTGTVYDLIYVNTKLYICVSGTMKSISPTTGTESTLGGGGFCTYNMKYDDRFIYNGNGTTLHIYDTVNNSETTPGMGVSVILYGAEKGHVYFDDNANFYRYDVANTTQHTLISAITSPGGDRRLRSNGKNIFMTIDDGAMEQIISTSPGSNNYNQESNFTTTQNSFFQSASIRDYYVIGGRVVAAVEAPISTTGLWVLDTFDNTSYRISPATELIDEYDEIAVFY